MSSVLLKFGFSCLLGIFAMYASFERQHPFGWFRLRQIPLLLAFIAAVVARPACGQTAIYSNQGDMGFFSAGFEPLPTVWDDLQLAGGGTLDEISIVLWHGNTNGRTVSGFIDLRLFDEVNNIPQGPSLGIITINDTFEAHPSGTFATLVKVDNLASRGIVLPDNAKLGVGLQLNDSEWSFPAAGPPRIGSSPGDNWLGNSSLERADAGGDFAWRLVVTGTQDSVGWNSPISGTWENDYNWDTGFAPLPTQDVSIGGVPFIDGPVADTTVKSLTLGVPTFASETLRLQPGVTLTATDSFDVVHNGLLNIGGGHLVTPNFSGRIEAFDSGSVTVIGGTFSPGTSDFDLSGSGNPTLLLDGASFQAGTAGTPADVTVAFEQDDRGTLRVENGGNLAAADLIVGGFDGSEGELVATGGGTTLNLAGKLTLGQRSAFQSGDARGTFRLEQGAVANVWSMDVGDLGQGEATIDNATLNVMEVPEDNDSGTLSIGGSGLSVLTVQNGGVVNTDFLDIATLFTDSALAVVTGPGSEIHATSGIAVGERNEGKLRVLDGARVTTGFLSTGNGASLPAGELNEIEIDGVGTQVEVTASLIASLRGSLAVTGGAHVTANAVNSTGGPITISGPGTLVDVSTTNVQLASLGVNNSDLRIEAGAVVKSRGLEVGTVNATNSTATITGQGTRLESEGLFFVVSNLTPGTLDIQQGAVVQRTGDVIVGAADTAQGEINVSGTNSQLNVAGNFYFSGARLNGQVFTVTGPGTLNVQAGGLVDVTGTIEPFAAGQVNLQGGELRAGEITLASGGGFTMTGGRLATDTFTGNLANDGGTLAPGPSAGITNITGQYDQNAGALEIEIFGGGGAATPGVDFDQLVADSISLGGVLDIVANANYQPALGDSFEIVSATASLAGDFASVVGLGLGNGLGFAVTTDAIARTVTLDVVASTLPLTGDYNADGQVDMADYTIWRDALGSTVSEAGMGADGNADGVVTEADYHAWQIRYAASTASLAASAKVPEPATIALACIPTICFLAMRRPVTLAE